MAFIDAYEFRTRRHEIDETTGRAAFAYSREGGPAWHGLGQMPRDGATPEEWLETAGLNWEAVMMPTFVKRDGVFIEIPNRFSLQRDDTGAELGSFTARYNPVQPRQIMDYFGRYILTDDRFSLETAGALYGGKIIWALAKFETATNIIGEKHVRYVMLTTSFDGSGATIAGATVIRVVCRNTYRMMKREGNSALLRISHATKWTDEVAAKAHKELAEIAGQFDQFREMAEHMAAVKFTGDQTREFLTRLLTKETEEEEISTRMKNQVAQLLAAYETSVGEGCEPDTGWAAWNAVTRYADHDRATRVTSVGETAQSARMASAFFGSGAALKESARKMLMDFERSNGSVMVPAGMASLIA